LANLFPLNSGQKWRYCRKLGYDGTNSEKNNDSGLSSSFGAAFLSSLFSSSSTYLDCHSPIDRLKHYGSVEDIVKINKHQITPAADPYNHSSDHSHYHDYSCQLPTVYISWPQRNLIRSCKQCHIP